jgi:hypothetical protein
MPGMRTTITDKTSGRIETHGFGSREDCNVREQMDSAHLPPPRPPDEVPKLTEWFSCYKDNEVVERFVSELRAQEYCDRGLADRWEKEPIKS